MNYSDKIFMDYLREILELLKTSSIKDYTLILIGGFLGFLGTYIIYILNRRNDFNDSLEKMVIELYIIAEEIRHNVFTIREEGYLYKYYSKAVELMKKNGNYVGQYHAEIMTKSDKLDIRLRDRELLSAKLSGLLQRHILAVGKSVEIDEKFKDYRDFSVLLNYFGEYNDLNKLQKDYDEKYIEKLKNELSNNFEPILYALIDEVKKSIYKKLKRKDLLEEFEK